MPFFPVDHRQDPEHPAAIQYPPRGADALTVPQPDLVAHRALCLFCRIELLAADRIDGRPYRGLCGPLVVIAVQGIAVVVHSAGAALQQHPVPQLSRVDHAVLLSGVRSGHLKQSAAGRPAGQPRRLPHAGVGPTFSCVMTGGSPSGRGASVPTASRWS